ncbi:efflux RND transporter permease subunit [candidate division CSSED10-310 bacterium]|uniref:Efflux RND transporter permease subunit n=1 Tax=candidate division CSSED10-310 bacterium TaxID=2855610 RepID=A0ABV6YSE0_UNCC1
MPEKNKQHRPVKKMLWGRWLKPIHISALLLSIFLCGLYTFLASPFILSPQLQASLVTVKIQRSGYPLPAVEESIKGFERSLLNIEGLTELKTICERDQVTLLLGFQQGREMEQVTYAIRQSLRTLQSPIEDTVTISYPEPGMQSLFFISLTGSTIANLSEFTRNIIAPAFENLPDAAGVFVQGEVESEIKICLDPLKMAQQNLTLPEIVSRIQHYATEMPAGHLKIMDKKYTLRLTTPGRDPNLVAEIPVKQISPESVIRVKDIASVKYTSSEPSEYCRVNGEPAVLVAISLKSGKSVSRLEKRIYEITAALHSKLPPGITLAVSFDRISSFKAALKQIGLEAGMGVILLLVVLLWFTGRRGTMMILLILILTAALTIIFLNWSGLGMSVAAISGFILALGTSVAAAIILLNDLRAEQDVENGFGEGATAVFSGPGVRLVVTVSLSSIIVFVPLLVIDYPTPHLLGHEFLSFIFVISTSLILTLLIISAYWFWLQTPGVKTEEPESLVRLTDFSIRGLNYVLAKKNIIPWCFVLLLVILLMLFWLIPKSYLNVDAEKVFFSSFFLPGETDLKQADLYARQLTRTMKPDQPARSITIVGLSDPHFTTDNFFYSSTLLPKIYSILEIDQERSQIISHLDRVHGSVNEQSYFSVQPVLLSSFLVSHYGPLVVELTGDDRLELQRRADELIQKMKRAGITDQAWIVDSLHHEEIELRPDDEALGLHQVKPEDLNLLLAGLLEPIVIIPQKTEQDLPRIVVQIGDSDQINEEQLRELPCFISPTSQVPLHQIVKIRKVARQTFLMRKNGRPLVRIEALPLNNVRAASAFRELLPTGGDKDDYGITLTGSVGDILHLGQTFLLIGFLALMLEFVLLSSLYHSVRIALLVLLNVPVSFCGAMLALFFSGATLNVFSLTGVVISIGLLTNNSIIWADYGLRYNGPFSKVALINITSRALKPILGVTLSAIVVWVPMLFRGPGSELRASIVLPMLCGVLVSCLFTVLILPVFVSALGRKGGNH